MSSRSPTLSERMEKIELVMAELRGQLDIIKGISVAILIGVLLKLIL